jgi:hypothetical protein
VVAYLAQEKHIAMQRLGVASAVTQSEAQKNVEVKLEMKVDVK